MFFDSLMLRFDKTKVEELYGVKKQMEYWDAGI